MEKEEFCKLFSSYYGEEVNDLKQISYVEFSGEALYKFVLHIIENGNLKSISLEKPAFCDCGNPTHEAYSDCCSYQCWKKKYDN